MADEVRRTETVEERPRDTVVVKEGSNSSSSVLLIILGIVVILLLVFYLWGNPFDNDNADTTPNVNVPNEVNVDVPSPDVNLPDVDINTTPNDTNTPQ